MTTICFTDNWKATLLMFVSYLCKKPKMIGHRGLLMPTSVYDHQKITYGGSLPFFIVTMRMFQSAWICPKIYSLLDLKFCFPDLLWHDFWLWFFNTFSCQNSALLSHTLTRTNLIVLEQNVSLLCCVISLLRSLFSTHFILHLA